MSPDTTLWLGSVAVVLLCAGIAGVGRAMLSSSRNPIRTRIRAYEDQLDIDRRFLRLRASGRQVRSAQAAAVAILLVTACVWREWWPVVAIFPALVGPRFWLRRRREKRIARIEEQLERWLLVLANALKASASLGEAMAASALHVRAPLGEEIDLVLKEFRLGTSLDRALENMNRRLASRSVAGALLVIRVARNTGGDLPSILETSAASLRELARLEGVARSRTAEGKLQTMVIGFIPFVLLGVLQQMDPGFLRPLAETFGGHLLVAGSAALWLAAILAARKILAVEI